ncbi:MULTISPECIES: hypothetical protein [unclassified Mesorhizobium]|uniref:hypothetical protein n=1 Tax=unclassified Mesorhizobium TaxID=325217 RepID=UPI0033370560
MSIERTDTSREKATARDRKIVMPDGKVRYDSTAAKDIAAELRAKSALGKREAKLKEAERKLNG